MPKDRRMNSSSFDRARVSPYAGSSKISDQNKSERYLPPVADEGDWEETRCPICMEQPHNAVLLLCSSREKGCQPYMCDTSYRHSNCLDQFCKSSTASSPTLPVYTPPEDVAAPSATLHRGRGEQLLSMPISPLEEQKPSFVCPLCRGQITGWLVIEPARRFLNSKPRSCSLEKCDFIGNYSELRKHARLDHPSDLPSEADAQRQSEWMRLERQRDVEDALSAYQPDFEDDLGDWDEWPSWVEWDEDYLWSDWNLFGFTSGFSENEDGQSEDNNMFTDLAVEFSFSFLDDIPSYPGNEATNSSSARSNDRVHDRRSTNSRSSYLEGNVPIGSRYRLNPRRGNASPRSRLTYDRGNVPSSRSSYHIRNSPSSSRSNDQMRNTTPISRSSYQRRNTATSSRSSYNRGSTSPVRRNASGRQLLALGNSRSRARNPEEQQ